MITLNRYNLYEKEALEFLENFYYNFTNNDYGARHSTLKDFFRQKDAVEYDPQKHTIKFKIGQYAFFIEYEMHLIDVQPPVIIRTYEEVNQTIRKLNYEQKRIIHIKELDIILDRNNFHWVMSNRPEDSSILLLFYQELIKYIEKVETNS